MTYIETLDGALDAWRSETQAQHEYDDWLAWQQMQAAMCPHCDGLHPDQTGWAGVRCTVGTGIQPWHWTPENEW
jgi:hypothetical protein